MNINISSRARLTESRLKTILKYAHLILSLKRDKNSERKDFKRTFKSILGKNRKLCKSQSVKTWVSGLSGLTFNNKRRL